MRLAGFLFLIFILKASGQVPNNMMFSLEDVRTELSLSATASLSDCLLNDRSCFFDSRYDDAGSQLSDYQNYGWIELKWNGSFSCSLVIADGGSAVIDLTATTISTDWTASESENWITLSDYTSQNGSQTITVTITANATGSNRTGFVVFTDNTINGFSSQYQIVQTSQ